MRSAPIPIVLFSMLLAVPSPAAQITVWEKGRPAARLVGPHIAGPAERIVPATLDGHLSRLFGWTIPQASEPSAADLNVLAGDETTNPAIRDLVAGGLDLGLDGIGGEGFRLISREIGGRRILVVAAKTPLGLKHGCQEIALFRIRATSERAWIEWPLESRAEPAWAYRGIYMLPCWSARDSIGSWERVLRFNSELTLNRVWFWLAGFPLIEEYGGEYKGTDLADPAKVRGLVDLCRAEGMKFYIGGGWFTWHHEKHAGGSIERGVRYYIDLLRLLPGVEGLYIEPPGEGYEVKEEVWRERTAALGRMMEEIRRDRPDFELAVAIGSFNSLPYRRAVGALDGGRSFWWWCWGDPVRDRALEEHPLVLRWHTVVRMSEYHGSTRPPGPEEKALTGFATSYDPGMGFGNPWSGWGKLGTDVRRDFDPSTLPYFSHQYRLRERAWNPSQTDEEFAHRLAARLFDADMPPESIDRYLRLASSCVDPRAAPEEDLRAIEAFVAARAGSGTPRNRDTLARMREALEGIRKTREAAGKEGKR
jgi:hypothetical protein